MRYQVPQFIEIEDKIFGPLTLKQFIYLAGGAGMCLIFFSLLPLWLTVVLAIPVMGLSAGLAFYEVNGRPLIVALEHATGYLFGHKLYLWKQRESQPTPAAAPAAAAGALPPVPKLSESKLRDLAWSLNIKDRATMGLSSSAQRTGFEI
ncbi:MAG TPA: PrgI family protein [Candidatus Paceibacterota bacterium]|nr:PrgI family protein [Candidatus Paceibacterota bacterium]